MQTLVKFIHENAITSVDFIHSSQFMHILRIIKSGYKFELAPDLGRTSLFVIFQPEFMNRSDR